MRTDDTLPTLSDSNINPKDLDEARRDIELLRTLFDGSPGSIGETEDSLDGEDLTQEFYLEQVWESSLWPPANLLAQIKVQADLDASVLHQHESLEYRESVRDVIVGVIDPDPSRTWALHIHHTRLPDIDSEYNNEDATTTSVRLVADRNDIERLIASQEALAMEKTVRQVGIAITSLVGNDPSKVWKFVENLRAASPSLVGWLPAMEAFIVGQTLGANTPEPYLSRPKHRI
jgi:hypothetical protein